MTWILLIIALASTATALVAVSENKRLRAELAWRRTS